MIRLSYEYWAGLADTIIVSPIVLHGPGKARIMNQRTSECTHLPTISIQQLMPNYSEGSRKISREARITINTSFMSPPARHETLVIEEFKGTFVLRSAIRGQSEKNETLREERFSVILTYLQKEISIMRLHVPPKKELQSCMTIKLESMNANYLNKPTNCHPTTIEYPALTPAYLAFNDGAEEDRTGSGTGAYLEIPLKAYLLLIG
ncbi:hypothetical protein DFH05DRAFT_1557900 [Lentinula detonsa]|uniref:Uncharacterized protein n=1 Tax=Lentinula detonsa TaxID=2804962 RepID=A0A9W8NYU1_9AGAR|nr:hypothetical protein DFH05DRAFT_1557900 [Lentinula detonsa]